MESTTTQREGGEGWFFSSLIAPLNVREKGLQNEREREKEDREDRERCSCTRHSSLSLSFSESSVRKYGAWFTGIKLVDTHRNGMKKVKRERESGGIERERERERGEMGRKVKEAEVKKLSPSQLSPQVQVSLSIHRSLSLFLSFFLSLSFLSFFLSFLDFSFLFLSLNYSLSRNGISPEAHLKILLPLFHPHLLHSFLQRRSLFERKTPLQGKEKKVTLCFSSSQNFPSISSLSPSLPLSSLSPSLSLYFLFSLSFDSLLHYHISS